MVMLRACSLIDTRNQANRVEDAIQDKPPKEMLLSSSQHDITVFPHSTLQTGERAIVLCRRMAEVLAGRRMNRYILVLWNKDDLAPV